MKHLPFTRLIILAVALVATVPGQAQSEPPGPPSVVPASPLPGGDSKEADGDTPLMIAEEMPIFRNDPNGPQKYISGQVTYPSEAIEAGAQGTVYASFVVQKDGSVAHVKIVRGVHPALDAEVLRVLGAMPSEWKPGIQNGKAEDVQYTVPVKFSLEDTPLFPFKKGKKKKRR